MSGICGIYRLDGRRAEGLEVMTSLLERRGPDGSHIWMDGSVALGHALLATTPEALHETLPLTHSGTGCTITADVRLDNREELLTALGLDKQSRVIGDGEILLCSYLTWGEACPQHFLGDFAFAIWDPRVQKVFAARDHMGVRQLTYTHLPGRLFAFATEPRVVLAAPDVPFRLHEGRIADFLEDFETINLTDTFFQGVYRLPPAHCLSISSKGLIIRHYWRMEPEPELRLASDEAYAQAFLEIFTEAVRCRLRSAGSVGSMLSGGMDSGSIAAVASRLLAAEGRGPLQTFSAVGPDPKTCTETTGVYAALKMSGLNSHLVSWADPDSWKKEVLGSLKRIDEPFDGHLNLPRAVYQLARMAGVRVVLDGVAGDVVLSRSNQIPWLLRQKQWLAAWREIRGERQFWGLSSIWQPLRRSLPLVLLPVILRRRRWLTRRKQLDRTGWVTLLPNLASRSELERRRSTFAQADLTKFRASPDDRIADILSPKLVVARERYDRLAASHAIEPRDPYLDLRLIQFVKRLPSAQLQAEGWPKMIQRRALKGLVPDEVRWAKGKHHLGGLFTLKAFEGPEFLQELALPAVFARQQAASGGQIPDSAEALARALPAGIDIYDQVYLLFWLRGIGLLDPEINELYATWCGCSNYDQASDLDGHKDETEVHLPISDNLRPDG